MSEQIDERALTFLAGLIHHAPAEVLRHIATTHPYPAIRQLARRRLRSRRFARVVSAISKLFRHKGAGR